MRSTYTHPTPAAATKSASATATRATRAARGLGVGLGAALALGPLAGCLRPSRQEVPLELRVETVPAGAAVTLDVRGEDRRALGNGPVAVAGLKLVRKEFVSGEVRYWLEDAERKLPRDPWRPAFASAPYAVGHDYALELTARARAADGREGASTLRLDHAAIRKLWDAPRVAIKVPLSATAPKPAAREGASIAPAPSPRAAPSIEAPPPPRNPAGAGAARAG